MKVVYFSPSLASDPNHGNAHFLRGVVAELQERGHEVTVSSREHGAESLSLEQELDDADLVLVHELNDPELVARIGRHRARHGGYRLLFHDTHHRAATAPEEMSRFDLFAYDGVLASGEVVRRIYLERGWAGRAWTWHEAADTRVFHPIEHLEPEADLVWIGNWGDGERSEELRRFLLKPARQLRLRGSVHGVGYPRSARFQIRLAGLRYRDWTPNERVPELFARHRFTVHVPDRPYVEALPGIPTIRPFEALACGIPLICSPWDDCEGLFRAEEDYLLARDCAEMREAMQAILEFPELAEKLRQSGLETIRTRHTCAHRVDELLAIDAELQGAAEAGVAG
ncbi:MAG TPA: glycosyltransferase [Solirubrobacterales bacterium]|nr:glycosyltransferase [Solirubrobacterales bacterium]